jgi:ring-1,2-phenylacetyl-CoA epoxidase subunit PaaD
METELTHTITAEEIWQTLEQVKDPEIPVLSVVDMGIITGVDLTSPRDGILECAVTMTPTFVGCPAIDLMKKDILAAVQQLGLHVQVNVDFETQWTTARMKPGAKEKLEKFGIAPPAAFTGELTLEQLNQVRCPHCGSTDTTLRSTFGSTLCRAIRFCFNCKQGFEQFKPI